MRSSKWFSFVSVAMVLGLVTVAGVRASAQQQAPAGRQGGQPPQNLKVLPKDIARPALTAIMRGYTEALGVKCNHCHVEDMAQRASDDNPKKDIARKMIKMTMDINATYLQGVGQPAMPDQPKVTCFTCHRGQVTPAKSASGN
jgi:hypothetical protein